MQLKPDDAELWNNLGNVLVELERPADALLSFQHALKLNPRHWDAAYQSGILLHQLERFEEALALFRPVRRTAAEPCSDAADARALRCAA